MSLPRKDLRVYLDPEVHAALLALAEVDGVEPAKLAEVVLQKYAIEHVQKCMLIAQRVDVAGLTRSRPVSRGDDRAKGA
jgi:hypothetical protein